MSRPSLAEVSFMQATVGTSPQIKGQYRLAFGRRLPFTLLLALLVLVLAWAIQLVRSPLVVQFGAADALDNLYLDEGSYLDSDSGLDKGYGGFFAPEIQPNGTALRWSERTVYLKLNWPLTATPLTATLQISAPRPDRPPNEPGTNLKITAVTEREENVLVKAMPIYGLPRDYSFLLPAHLTPDLSEMKLRLEADSSFRPSKSDTRALSLLFFRLTLMPNYAAFSWQDWLGTLERPILLAVITFFCGMFGRSLFLRRVWLWLLEGLVGLLLLASLVSWPLTTEPYYAAWAVIMSSAWLLFWLAGIFARRAPNLPTPFVYAATLFPVLPIAQFALGHLNLYTVNPGSVTFAVYFGALLFCAGMYVRLNLSRSRVVTAFEQSFARAMLGAAVVSYLYNHFYVWQSNLYRGSDFKVYYYALLNFQSGKPLYDLASVINHPGDAARMPPTFGLLMWPFVNIFTSDSALALDFWRGFNELLFVLVIFVLLKVFGGVHGGQKFTSAVLFMCLSFNQVAETIAYGQFNIILLLGLALVAWYIKRGRDGWAGVMLAVPISIKLIPITWTLFLLTSKRRRSGIGLVLGGSLMLGLTTLVVGWDTVWTYLTQVVFAVNRPDIGISNQSLFGALGRLSVPLVMDDYKGNLQSWVLWSGYGCVIIMTLLTGWVIWHNRGSDSNDDLLKLSSLNLLMLLIPPFIWFHYVTMGLVSVLTLLLMLGRDVPNQPLARWQLLVFGVAFATLGYGGRADFFFTQAVGLARLGASYRFLAVLALWLLNLWLIQSGLLPATGIKKADEKTLS